MDAFTFCHSIYLSCERNGFGKDPKCHCSHGPTQSPRSGRSCMHISVYIILPKLMLPLSHGQLPVCQAHPNLLRTSMKGRMMTVSLVGRRYDLLYDFFFR